MELIEALQKRYAVKRMTGEKVSQDKVNKILEAATLSPSAAGLQPYTIIVIDNPELKKKLQPVSNNQPQIVESSHLLIFAAWDDISEGQVDDYINNVATTRNIPTESLNGLRGSLLGIVNGRTQEGKYQWAARQAYIAFGIAIAAAATENVDASPMEGFSPEGVDEILGLKEKGLRSVTFLALGVKNPETDYLINAKKVRRQKDKLILNIS
jgi:nitroreductase/dihydropteridine reductase